MVQSENRTNFTDVRVFSLTLQCVSVTECVTSSGPNTKSLYLGPLVHVNKDIDGKYMWYLLGATLLWLIFSLQPHETDTIVEEETVEQGG